MPFLNSCRPGNSMGEPIDMGKVQAGSWNTRRRDPKTLASPAENIAVFIKEMVTRQDGRKLKQSKPGLPKRFKVAYAHWEFAQTALQSKNDWMISEGTCSFETGTPSWLEKKKNRELSRSINISTTSWWLMKNYWRAVHILHTPTERS